MAPPRIGQLSGRVPGDDRRRLFTQRQWLARRLVATAPAGTAEARLVLQFFQSTNQSGAVHLDNVSFGVQTAPLPGDFNGDGTVDSQDLETWMAEFGSTSTAPADATRTATSTAPTSSFGSDSSRHWRPCRAIGHVGSGTRTAKVAWTLAMAAALGRRFAERFLSANPAVR